MPGVLAILVKVLLGVRMGCAPLGGALPCAPKRKAYLDDAAQDLGVALDAQRAEHEEDGDVVLDVVHAELDAAAVRGRLARELERQRLGHAEARLLHAADLGHVRVVRRLVVDEHVRAVLGDAVLRDDDLLAAVDHEVAAVVVAALVVHAVRAGARRRRRRVEHAVARADHDRQAAEADRAATQPFIRRGERGQAPPAVPCKTLTKMPWQGMG